MRFASFASFASGFIIAVAVNPPETKLAKRTSVNWFKLAYAFVHLIYV
jgi:hypothetical protein